jgi:hypothetical protein
MTLIKNKARITVNQRKMSALHHRQNSKYVRPYLPYLPLFLIMGGSLAAGQYLPHSSFNSTSNASYNSRVQTVFGSNSALLIDLAYLILAVLVIWFIIRHYKRIKSVIIREERLLAKHYFFDALLAIMIGCMCLLIT